MGSDNDEDLNMHLHNKVLIVDFHNTSISIMGIHNSYIPIEENSDERILILETCSTKINVNTAHAKRKPSPAKL